MSNNIIHIRSINEAHQLFGLPKPKHPQISIFRHKDLKYVKDVSQLRFTMDLYMIAMKDELTGKLNYGRETYDFQEGTMVFIAPGQVFWGSAESDMNSNDWILLFDADFIQQSQLGTSIDQYHFFRYETDEALHLSDDEKMEMTDLVKKIEKEYQQNIDKHTHEIMLSHLETILKYSQRFYDRQFITRKSHNKGYIVAFENYLKKRFSEELTDDGIPSVSECGKALNMSAHYLSDLLKAETGKSAKEYIDLYLVNKAKNILRISDDSISEVAYRLGFDYPNHFSKFFKAKTGMSPKEYRNSHDWN